MTNGTLRFSLMETDVYFKEIAQCVCFAKSNRMGSLSIYIKIDDETAIGVNNDFTARMEPEELVNVVRISGVCSPEHFNRG